MSTALHRKTMKTSVCLAVLALAMYAGSAYSADLFWYGTAGDGLWNTPANWSTTEGSYTASTAYPNDDMTYIVHLYTHLVAGHAIDITIPADCTDAATDILGRNYAKGKTFSDVLKEFEQGAGTRYNPDIVECIKNDEKLIGELTALTTENRLEIYKTVYSRYIR